MSIDERLQELEDKDHERWQRLTYLMRKHLDIWTHKYIKPYWKEMKLSYMPVLFNIDVQGSTAMDISRATMIRKQTVSRTIKELEEKGIVTSKINKNDRRSELLELTEKGKQLALDAQLEAKRQEEIYKGLVGEKKYAIAMEVINKIINYHESLDIGEDEYYGD
ncbi:MarR family winged helix-turn-helix transcriptional regulator [Chitinophaga tropicalis]|uniref:MarR family transcriptional regulator n=1 Tax=Chitinophaga tropicalis TaxID=2683588 RepID=A0A7K1U237_9BACT|nr:MarR family transcriptional regulator [Chitinophaga tropicalis]MVT08413.1 MarR family transcriptional regulator [Chitinophaga tropicalis]